MTTPTNDQDQLAADLAQFVRAALLDRYGGADGASGGEVLAALLAGGEVREEWGVRLTYDDGSGHDDEWGDRTRQLAEDRIAHHHRMRARYPGGPFGTERMWMVTPALIRRFVFVTAAQIVDPGSEGSPS
jgi:hypothetical protein